MSQWRIHRMSNEVRDELLAISRELEDQLKFYREIGVEDIGGSVFDTELAPGADCTPSAGLYLTSAGSPSLPQTLPAEAQTRADAHLGQAGLFGDIILPGSQSGPRSRSASPPILEFSDTSLEAIREDIGDCRRCKLCEHRR